MADKWTREKITELARTSNANYAANKTRSGLGSWEWLRNYRRLLKFNLEMAVDLDRKDEIARARLRIRRLNVEGIAMIHEPFHLSNEARDRNAYLEKQDSGTLTWCVDRGKAASAGASAKEAATSEPSRYRSRSRSRKQVRLEPAREPVRLLQAPTSSTEPASASVRLTPAPTPVRLTAAPVRLKPVLPHRRRSTSHSGARNREAFLSEKQSCPLRARRHREIACSTQKFCFRPATGSPKG